MLLLIASAACPAIAHDGPDPAARWHFDQASAKDATLQAVLGPALKIQPGSRFEKLGRFSALLMDGEEAPAVVVADESQLKKLLPTEAFTISAWASIDTPTQWGGLIGYFQDNGDNEKGWVLGYDQAHFTVGLATTAADDGDGRMTYLKGKTPYKPGRFHHVCATYDGKTLSLYIDGKLDAQSTTQSGPILYPDQPTAMTLGAYRDVDEDNRLHGRLSEVVLYHDAATAKWVAGEFEHGKALTAMSVKSVEPAIDPTVQQQMLVKPFLQMATKTGITVTWETTRPSKSVLYWGTTTSCEQKIDLQGEPILSRRGFIYQQRIEGLVAHTQYFYRVESTADNEALVKSEVLTFQTAPDDDTPFAFAVVGDTQGNLKVAGKIAELAWSERPSFLLHAGDLVSTGTNKGHWTEVFFPSLDPLISRVPIFPVLGNHEDDAAFYYQYMALPEPEYYYTFTYGNMQFFMIDTNRNVQPGSEQYKWLQAELAKSNATWKIVCHHHPPYSSDENDFGDLWKTNQSTRGDTRIRPLCELYDKHKIDVVWTGHIHSYERTWPIYAGKPTDRGGTVYMVTGGGGGDLETPGPFRTAFSNVVHRDHHYTMVHVNGKTIEVRVYDQAGTLFDTYTLDKREVPPQSTAAKTSPAQINPNPD